MDVRSAFFLSFPNLLNALLYLFIILFLPCCLFHKKNPVKEDSAAPKNTFFEKNTDNFLKIFRPNEQSTEIYFVFKNKNLSSVKDTTIFSVKFFAEKNLNDHLFEGNVRCRIKNSRITGSFTIPSVPMNGKYNLKLYHPQTALGYLIQDFLNISSDFPASALITDTLGYLFPSGYCDSSPFIKIRTSKSSVCTVEMAENDPGFPPPPFLESDYVPQQTWKKIFSISGDTILPIKEKVSVRIVDERNNVLEGIYRGSIAFPGISDGKEMTEATRYIMNKEEYLRCMESSEPKKEIEFFWKEIGGSKERARELIRQYYNRVIEANELFTDFSGPGFKTDRGMIYIVFGKPDHVYYHNQGEIWHYGSTPEKSTLNFTFRLKNKRYELERWSMYKDHWYFMVDSWRQGKIHVFGK